MKRIKQVKKAKFATYLNYFVKQQNGVYSILMAGMGAILMATIAFSVDGSGVILDQARLSDSLEQASLAVTSENNSFRKDKYQLKGKNDDISIKMRNQRDQEIVENYVKSYIPQAKSWKSKEIQCKQNKDGPKEIVQCHISGSIIREAWLPLTFANTADSNSSNEFSIFNTGTAEKIKSTFPLDVMLVADFSGSMNYRLDNPAKEVGENDRNSKIAILRAVLNNLMANALFKEDDSLNRIGLTSFGLGAPHNDMRGKCVLPYQLKPQNKTEIEQLAKIISGYSFKNIDKVLTSFAPNIDFDKTIKQINQFDGSTKHYPITFNLNPEGINVCVGKRKGINVPATKYWFDRHQQQEFTTLINNIAAEGATLSSSGLLVATNLMMNKSKLRNSSEVGNTQRVIIVLSDGKDEYVKIPNSSQRVREFEFRNITNKLIDKGLCDVIRDNLDKMQDPNYPQHKTKLAFIAFGYEPTETNEAFWKKCVGDKNFFVANKEDELLDAFKQVVTKEEVGHNLN